MPELPEVETVARTLAPQVCGRRIVGIAVRNAGTWQGGTAADVLASLHPCIMSVSRRGKLLLLHFGEGGPEAGGVEEIPVPTEAGQWPLFYSAAGIEQGSLPLEGRTPDEVTALAFHLRMTGRLFVYPQGTEPGKHTRVIFDLDDGRRLFFDDTRKFGQVRALCGQELAEWKFQQYMRDYLRVITSVDRNVGRVLDYLEENGLMDNTLIVYTSDQGFYMGEHGWFDKRFMYEESFRTPLLVRLPGGRKGDVAQLVQNIDYGPTFLDLAGIEVPEEMHGESFLPLLKGEKTDWRDALYYHFYEYPAEHAVKRHYGVRDNRYKLIHFYNDIDSWELYDLKNDPNELNNIYGQPGTERITKRMMKKLTELQEKYDDPIRTEGAN